MRVVRRDKKSGIKLRRAVHHQRTGKYVRQASRTNFNVRRRKIKNIEAQIAFLQERLNFYKNGAV